MPERAATRRLFFALWPEAALAERLHAIGRRAQAQCGGRPMRRETLHATLAFLGDVPADRFDAAAAAADTLRAPAFDLALDSLGYWRHNQILWAGASTVPAALDHLAAGLGEALRRAGFSLERRAFALHITLLRHAACAQGVPEPLDECERLTWPVVDFALVESQLDAHGAHYEVRQRWPLAAALG